MFAAGNAPCDRSRGLGFASLAPCPVSHPPLLPPLSCAAQHDAGGAHAPLPLHDAHAAKPSLVATWPWPAHAGHVSWLYSCVGSTMSAAERRGAIDE
jgi:hypothetical protein